MRIKRLVSLATVATTFAVGSAVTVAGADFIHALDASGTTNGKDIQYQSAANPSHLACAARGTEVAGSGVVRGDNEANRFFANESIAVTASVSPAHAGISVTGETLTAPSSWDRNGADRTDLPFVLASTIAANVPDGTYTATVTATGQTSEIRVSDTFQIVISCGTSGSTNTAPTLTWDTNPATVDESSTAERTYSFSVTDPDTDTWSFVSTFPTCGTNGTLVAGSASLIGKAGSFKCIFDDGPKSSTVSVKVSDGTAQSAALTQAVEITNVIPVASLTRSGPANVFSGTSVTYTASATDASGADTLAGFTYSFNSGAFGTGTTLTQTYEACGAKTESVTARDKDGGVSTAKTAGVSVYDGGFHGAIVPATRNQVQKGRVVPVQIRVGCGGSPTAGLTPAILLVNGDADPDTDSQDPAVVTPTTVSSADTTGVMRPTTEGYIYNLQIPSTATAGTNYTILVRPWGSAGPTLKALVQIRK